MKKILASLALVCLLATSAHAVTRWSYNPSFGNPIRVIGEWAIGNVRLGVFTVHHCVNGEKVFAVYSVWRNFFTGEIELRLDGSVVTGAC